MTPQQLPLAYLVWGLFFFCCCRCCYCPRLVVGGGTITCFHFPTFSPSLTNSAGEINRKRESEKMRSPLTFSALLGRPCTARHRSSFSPSSSAPEASVSSWPPLCRVPRGKCCSRRWSESGAWCEAGGGS